MYETNRPFSYNSPIDQITLLVVLHHSYELPSLPTIYKQIQVGFDPTINSSYLRDNTENHIADKNSSFCELTALYWAWKNLHTNILGLCHYRRYFGSYSSLLPRTKSKKNCNILSESQIISYLQKNDIILPKKRYYWIETRKSQYEHAHHIEDLQCVEQILAEYYPDYIPDWKWMLNTRSGHICNMFIMRWELVDAYCSWLFDILFEAERRLDISSYSINDRRVFGFLGERLLDVWIHKNGLVYAEVPMINLEKQHLLKKGTAFIVRKFQK